jgi:hypothetical protein
MTFKPPWNQEWLDLSSGDFEVAVVAWLKEEFGAACPPHHPISLADLSVPDFTIRREGRHTIYWEHLGMLGSARYSADWEAKKLWYAEHGILPWTERGGTAGVLVWSDEEPHNRGIDVQKIEQTAKQVFT